MATSEVIECKHGGYLNTFKIYSFRVELVFMLYLMESLCLSGFKLSCKGANHARFDKKKVGVPVHKIGSKQNYFLQPCFLNLSGIITFS